MGDAIYDGIRMPDNGQLKLGNDSDGVLLLRSATLAANTALTGVLVGTPVTPALPANSVILSDVTASGDILLATNKGGNSIAGLWLDGSAGDAALMASSSASVDHYIAGVKVLDHAAGVFAFQEATSITTTAGALTLAPLGGQHLDITLSAAGDLRVNTSQLYVDTSEGYIGIGMVPLTKLHILGAANKGINLRASSGANDVFSLSDNGTNTLISLNTVAGVEQFYVTTNTAGASYFGSKLGVGGAAYATLPTGGLSVAGGVMIGANSLNNLFDDASGGAGSTPMYIGNAVILVGNGVNFGPAAVASITVVNGQITAIS